MADKNEKNKTKRKRAIFVLIIPITTTIIVVICEKTEVTPWAKNCLRLSRVSFV